jgi:hypothetical protein
MTTATNPDRISPLHACFRAASPIALGGFPRITPSRGLVREEVPGETGP